MELWLSSQPVKGVFYETAHRQEGALGVPRGPQGVKRPADVVGCAVHVAKIATGEIEETTYKTPGRARAGRAGGRARSDALTSSQRSEIARRAATARWNSTKGDR